jgi:type IV pilus assembly protein PilE
VEKTRGFTLIELIIAVAVVGILVAIAVPSYQNHLRKARRADAQGFITQIAQRQQQYLLDARTYAYNLSDLGLTAPPTVSSHYTIAITGGANPPTYTITADPAGSTVQVDDGVLSMDQTGLKKRLVSGVDKGW